MRNVSQPLIHIENSTLKSPNVTLFVRTVMHSVRGDGNQKVSLRFLDCERDGCEEHFSEPKTRRVSWVKKIMANKMRDARTVAELVSQGWKVFRIWEHDLADTVALKGFALRVARAADTPDTCEKYTRDRRAPTPGLELMPCIPCGHITGHRTKDLTGFNVYKEAECEECFTFTRRIKGIALRGGHNGK